VKLFIILLLFINCQVQAQLRVYNTALSHPDTAILFVGISNFLQVEGLGSWADCVVLADGASGTVDAVHKQIHIRCADTGYCQISITRNRKTVFSRRYRVQKIPPLKPVLGVLTDTIMKTQFIIGAPTLRMYRPDCVLKEQAAVLAYSVEIRNAQGGVLLFASAGGNILTEEMRRVISRLQPGSKIIFGQIKYRGAFGCRIQSGSLTIQIRG
jgi:hypothetical protein